MLEQAKPLIKACIIVTQGEPGGAQKYVYDLATHLNTEQFDVTVAHGETPDTWLTRQINGRHIKTHFFKHLKRSISPIRDIWGILEMAIFFKKKQFDVVHCNSSKAGILVPIAAKFAGIQKVIFTCHGWAFDDPRPRWEVHTYKILHKAVSRLTSTIICVSQYSQQAGIKIGIPETKLQTINNSYDLKQLPQLSKQQARSDLQQRFNLPNKPIIGTIANYYPTKGLLYFLAAIKQLHPVLPDYIFCLIGNGEQQKAMDSFITTNNLQDTIFLLNGVLDAGKYIPGFELFVLPSVKEAFPYALLEAMAAGVPIVASDVGGVSEALSLYPIEYYRLVQSKNPTALTQAIKSMAHTPPIETDELTIIRKSIDIGNMITATKNTYLA